MKVNFTLTDLKSEEVLRIPDIYKHPKMVRAVSIYVRNAHSCCKKSVNTSSLASVVGVGLNKIPQNELYNILSNYYKINGPIKVNIGTCRKILNKG